MKIGLKMKKSFYIYGSLVLLLLLTLGVTFATFTDKADFAGSSFSVASADIKLLDVIDAGTSSDNLVDSKPGPQFENITSEWHEDYPVQIYNNATSDVSLESWANYENLEVSDEGNLRESIYVTIYDWEDANGDGTPEQDEFGTSYGTKTILRWKNDGFDLGLIPQGEVRSLALRFHTNNLSTAKQGHTLFYDFEFSATGL